MITILHPSGDTKARIVETRDGFRVTLLERGVGTFVSEADRSATPNWLQIWTALYDASFHVVCDHVHEHVMASRRDALVIPGAGNRPQHGRN